MGSWFLTYRLRRIISAILGVALLAACEERATYSPQFSAGAEPGAQQTYSFAVHPLHNPQRLSEVYGPLVEHVNGRLTGAELRLVASRDYEAYTARLAAQDFDLALPNPYQTLQARKHGYRVFGKMGDDAGFRGLVLVRKDSGLDELTDLKGKAISYPAATALAATMMPQQLIQDAGVDVTSETTSRYVGSQESSILSVYSGRSDAGATWPLPWEAFKIEHPKEAAALEVRWSTPPLVNNSLMAHQRVPAEVTRQVGAIVFSLHESEAGRAILRRIHLSRFEPADEATYAPVESFLKTFEAEVGPAEPPRSVHARR